MFTVDASVHLSALNPAETQSAASRAFLEFVHQQEAPLFCPTLLLVEVAAAVARVFGDAERAIALAGALRGLSNQNLVPLDDALADRATRLAARARLRGADAVYAAVAQQYGTTLVTLDRQQLDRLPPDIKTAQPTEVLGQ
ncbi:MAG: PIN domain-containing protein [Anaerolineae bacterium]|jgi:predicted nucleic acid-binding protein